MNLINTINSQDWNIINKLEFKLTKCKYNLEHKFMHLNYKTEVTNKIYAGHKHSDM